MKLDIDVQVKLTEEEEERGDFTMGSALKAVAKVFAVSEDDLLSKRRAHYITTPRFALMYLGYYMTHNSTTTVGRYIGRDHTTVIHGCQRAIGLKRSNKAFAERLEQARELAVKYDRERRKKLEIYRQEVQKGMERACERVAKTGELSGDKVVFDGGNPNRQSRVA